MWVHKYAIETEIVALEVKGKFGSIKLNRMSQARQTSNSKNVKPNQNTSMQTKTSMQPSLPVWLAGTHNFDNVKFDLGPPGSSRGMCT